MIWDSVYRGCCLCRAYSSEGEELLTAEVGSWESWEGSWLKRRDGGWSCSWVWRRRFWYVHPDGRRQKRLGEAEIVSVQEWEEWDANDLSSCVHCVLRGLAVQCSSHTTQWCIWSGCSGWRIIFPYQQYSVGCSDEALTDVHPKKLAAQPLHSSTDDGLGDGWKMSARTTLSSSTQAFQHSTRDVVWASSLAAVDGGMFFSNWLVTGTKPGCGVGGVLCQGMLVQIIQSSFLSCPAGICCWHWSVAGVCNPGGSEHNATDFLHLCCC